ncbi:MAG: hypothetical protein IPG61_03550 [bacterium]|nr:hypothetical protein [bacterium]
MARGGSLVAARSTERCAMEFMRDMLFDGRTLRVLTVIDVFTRECLALDAS